MSGWKDKDTVQRYANYAIILGMIATPIAIFYATKQYSISKQQYEWGYGEPQLQTVLYVHPMRTFQTSEYSYALPSYIFLICNLKGRPAILLDVRPEIQGPWDYFTEFNFSRGMLHQGECEEIEANSMPMKPVTPEKLDGLYKLNLTLYYHDGKNPKTEYLFWNAFEIKNRRVSPELWFER